MTTELATTGPRIAPELIERLREIVGDDGLLCDPDELLVYDCDGYVVKRNVPDAVVFPASTQQVAAVVRLLGEFDVPFLPRGAGTSLAGGCLPVGGGVVISLTRMRTIHEVNIRDRYAVVDAGLVTQQITQRLQGTGYHYAPDPSSAPACTIGGNVATNAGGAHTLKYGVTMNHVLGLEVVLPDGSIVELGGPAEETPGYDLTGLFVGSEGTFGLCTKVTVRISRDPAAYRTMLCVFDTVSDSTHAISEIIGAGIVPAALELMDRGMIEAAEAAYEFGYFLDAGAILIVEVDGLEIAVDAEADEIVDICRQHGAREVRRADTAEEREQLWKFRKLAAAAIGRLSPGFCTQDGVVPRTKLPEALDFVADVAARHDVRLINVAHAGDGNLHPVLLFDERDTAEITRVLEASEEILCKCVELGGSITGEHGVGVEKIDLMDRQFNRTDLKVMNAIRQVFNPDDRCSRRKMLPTAQ